ncbi:MAG: hypothetical protein ACRDR6_16525 [Pseudonocardiaceae bacterium]
MTARIASTVRKAVWGDLRVVQGDLEGVFQPDDHSQQSEAVDDTAGEQVVVRLELVE